jgi:hypothetical protein
MNQILRTDEFELTYDKFGLVSISGILRLPTPISYNDVFQPIKEFIETGTSCIQIDLSRVEFLNSSGITALARLIVMARSLNREMVLIGRDDTPWQRKSLISLQRLWDKVDVQLN